MKRTILLVMATAILLSPLSVSFGAEAKLPKKSQYTQAKKIKLKEARPGLPARSRSATRSLSGAPSQNAVMPNPGAILPLLEYRQKCLDSFWGTCPKPAK